MGYRPDSRWVSFWVLFAIVAVFIIYALAANSPESYAPLGKLLNGKYDGYELEVQRADILINVTAREPRAYIKALSDAVERIEKLSGRKTVHIWVGGAAGRIYVTLQESVKKAEK